MNLQFSALLIDAAKLTRGLSVQGYDLSRLLTTAGEALDKIVPAVSAVCATALVLDEKSGPTTFEYEELRRSVELLFCLLDPSELEELKREAHKVIAETG
jgi:hypothetical protein